MGRRDRRAGREETVTRYDDLIELHDQVVADSGESENKADLWSPRMIGALVGVSGSCILGWQKRGYLRRFHAPTLSKGNNVRAWTRTADLDAFLRDRRYWPLVRVDSPAVARYRPFLLERQAARTFSSKEVADRFAVARSSVSVWVNTGILTPSIGAGVHSHRFTYADLEGFIVPATKIRTGIPRRPFSRKERIAIWQRLYREQPLKYIAEKTGRNLHVLRRFVGKQWPEFTYWRKQGKAKQ
jgi:hypothetical protein